MNLPNLLTWLRVLLIPIFVGVFLLGFKNSHLIVTILFAVAAVTDWLDGYLARRWNQTSSFGAFLDPVADKLMVSSALLLIVQADPRWFLAVAALVIINREITISALREWMASLGERGVVAVSWIGKLKTTVQMLALLLLLYREPIAWVPVYDVGLWLLVLAAILTLWSMVQYLLAAWKVLKRD